METKRWWIVGHDDMAWGPFEKSALSALVAEGKLRADGLLCREGDARWSPIGSFAELAEIIWPPATQPRAPVSGSTPPQASIPRAPQSREAALRSNELDPIPGWQTVLLSIPTLGLWGAFNFYRSMRVYRRLAGNEPTNVETLFWVMLGVLAFGAMLLPGVITVPMSWALFAAAVIPGALLVRETLRLRDLAIIRLVPQAETQPEYYPAVKSDDWHFGLWITGAVLCTTGVFAIVGVPILVAQALAWFKDWDLIATLARGGARNQSPLTV